MNRKKDIEKLVNETMDVTKRIDPVASNPFLYEKIMDRLKQGSVVSPSQPFILRPALRLAVIVLFIVLNGWFIVRYGFPQSELETVITENDVSYIIDSYALDDENTTLYN